MKSRILSLFAVLLFGFSTPGFSANIPITGEHMIIGSADYTFYATPVLTQGATFTWNVTSGTIVAQNTDLTAGPVYVTIRWTTPGLYQDYVQIADNQGNSGSFDVYVGVSFFAGANAVARTNAMLEAIGALKQV